MLLKKIFAQWKIILEETMIVSKLQMIKNVHVAPRLENFLRTPINDNAFSL